MSFGPNPLTLTNGGTTYGSSDFTSSKTDLASQINSNSTTILSFTITPTTASTPVGLTIDITATIPATNHADATNVSITGTSLASFLLQSRSQVVDRLTSILSTNPPAPDRFDASDQDGSPITATATFSVPADGAPLRVDSCDVALANGVTDVGAQFTVNKLTTFPFTVGAGQTKSVTFTVKATAAAVEGEVIALTATFAGTDTNSGVQTTAKADQRFGVRDAATFVIGEPDLNTSTAGTTASAFTLPWASLAAKGPDGITRLFVADTGNNRVLIFQPLPSVVNTAATTVLGEPSFVTGTVNRNAGQTTDNGMSAPKALWVTGTTLIVADTGNNRVLIYNDYTTLAQRDATPDREIGQISFFTGSANKGNAAPDANTLSAPVGVAVTGSGSAAGLVVADSGNNRVLVYNSLSALDRFGTVPADKVFGQPDFLTNTVALTTTAGTVNAPLGVTVKANQLFVADTGNNRVLVFNDVTNLTNTNATSDVVLGQADGTGSSANRGGSTAKDSFNQPTSTYVAGNNLFVVDSSNNRVVVYPNASGITNTSLPTGLIGQQYYTDNGANNVNVSAIVSVPDAFSLRAPRGGFASSTGTVFWPADTGNNRLIKVPLP
ncbi:MAG: hypothetical protein HY303_14765 [Candidatus Wallbacteria bacterium]|nr:hypothetical protein [Candidatus Wallbacteria bacterium]